MSRSEVKFWWSVYVMTPVIGIAGAFLYSRMGL